MSGSRDSGSSGERSEKGESPREPPHESPIPAPKRQPVGKPRRRALAAPAALAVPAAVAAPAVLTAGHFEPELLETIIRLTSSRIAYLDQDGRFLHATAATGRGAGVPVELLVGQTPAELESTAAQQQRFAALRLKMMETGQAVREVLTSAGEPDSRAYEVILEPVRAADGTITGAVATAWDVTELTEALQRVARLDRIYAILTEIDQASVSLRDPDQLHQEACRIAADVGGFELAWIGLVEANGDVRVASRAGRDQAVLDGIAVSIRNDRDGRDPVAMAIRKNRTVVVEDVKNDDRMAAWRSRLADTDFRTAAAFPIRMAGQPIGAIALYSSQVGYFDADERRLFEELAGDLSFALESIEAERGRTAAEEAQRDSERRYRDLFEMNPLPMWVFDVETLRFLAVNDAAVRNYGYSREEFLEMTVAEVHPPGDLPALLEDVAAPPSQDYRRRDPWRHVRKDGTLMEVEMRARDLESGSRRTRLVSAIDVTEQRRLEAQLADATRMEAMGHLAGGIAHDFNNLLTAVIGYADLLVLELGDNPLAENATEIRRAGNRAAELTRQVLAFARRQVLAPRPVDVNAVVGGVCQMLRRLIAEQVRLVTELAPQPAVVMADPGQLEQVLVNLAINARDAMPEGGVLEIGVTRLEDAAPLDRGMEGPAVLVTVRDTGEGMDAETLAHAFEPFFTTKQIGAGTGLGLATVYGIVRQSNGAIWAESDVGRGTTVSVLLELVDAEPEPVAEPTLSAAPDTAAKATILVVEDEPTVRSFVVISLERVGYRVLVAGSPAEAAALTGGLQEPIDLLLTDLLLPDTNGRALAERLVASRPSMRVVVMSGYGSDLTVGPESGPAFVAKPFTRDELLTIVAKTLAEPSRPSLSGAAQGRRPAS
ncbi:MAG: PAS domain S-box protein [Candidatus Limnocylindrales bacterium]